MSRVNPLSAPRNGVTLIEVMISMVLVSTILLVSLTASANLSRNNHDRRNTNHGATLVAQFLDEVSSNAFRDRVDPGFGLEADEDAADRTTFDDVDDYQGYNVSPPTHRDGTAVIGFDGWSLSVSITPADPNSAGIITVGADENSPIRVISVVCTSPDGTTSQGSCLVSDVQSNLQPAASFQNWRRVKLTFKDREVSVTAPLRNSPDPSY